MIVVIIFFVPSLKLLNLSRIPPANLTIGVRASRNALPIGISCNLRSSKVFWNLTPTASSTLPSSRSDKIASSSTDAPAKPSALAA